MPHTIPDGMPAYMTPRNLGKLLDKLDEVAALLKITRRNGAMYNIIVHVDHPYRSDDNLIVRASAYSLNRAVGEALVTIYRLLNQFDGRSTATFGEVHG